MTARRNAGRLLTALAAAATLTAGTLAQAEAPAQAAPQTYVRVATVSAVDSTTQPFRITYGASITEGDIIFYNRSLQIGGYVKAVSDSRTVLFVGYNENGSCYFEEPRTASAGTTKTFGFEKTCDVAGGFLAVDVYFPV
ncbi:hypothetical protein ACIBF5_24475 [Micromonospora sp. NPDC050417]|uniref:hypothetical protein n=1 Tax=Micromonospora sp. NPDC050417 TaxID=3364280 RepID=UPI0037A6AFC1